MKESQARSSTAHTEVTQHDGDFFTKPDLESGNGLRWTTNLSGRTRINELRSWTTRRLDWEVNSPN